MSMIPTSSNQVPDECDLLSLAALFSGDFSIDWLVELTGKKSSQILFALEEGIRQGCLTQRGAGLFSFTNLNEQKKRKEQLSPEENERLHRRIADLLIKELPDDDKKASALAHHLLSISNSAEGCSWLVKAGDAHLRDFNNEAALECYAKVLDGLSRIQGEKEDLLFTEAAIKYSKVSRVGHDTKKVLSMLHEAMMRSKRWEKKSSQALIEMHLAKIHWFCSRYQRAMRHFESGWSMAKELDDTKLMRSATTFGAFFLYWQGRFKDAVRSYEQSVSDVEKYPKGRFPLLAGLMLGHSYAQIGQVTQGLGMLDSIIRLCQERGDPNLLSYARGTIGMIMLDIRRIDDALYYLESSIDEVNRKHNEWERINGKLTLSLVCYLKNDMGRAISNLREFLELSRHVHVNVRPYPYLLELCWAMDEGKFPRLGGLSFQEELRRMIGGKNIFMKGVAYRYQALLLKREGHFHNNIIKSLNLSMRWLEESGHQIELANSQIELARQYLLLGNSGGAKEIAMRAFETIAPLNEALFPDDLKSLIKGPIHVENLMKDIMKLSQEVITIRDNKDLVQHILSTVNRITGAERGAIFLLDRSTKTPKLNLRASKNLTSDQVTDQSFTSSLKMVKEVALSGKGLILGSNQAGKSDSFSGGAIRSRICVPMIFGNKVVGVLYHDNRLLSSAFRESDLEFLNYFAAQAAIALDNVRAYEEIQQLNQKLKEEKSYYEEQHLHSLHFEEIVGESPPIMKVLDRVGQVAKTETNVLILGETGVGKELVAKALHRHSCRCNRPFIRVFCSAIPDNLIPSELFGHEKGAFTGAVSRTIGRFELADGGTIFLDEIGDLPLDVQVRLLRVLQNKEFERIGSSETLRSDFRLVTATNHDLEQAIKAGRFRSDLYYRLNVFPIFVPPLRERKEDIPLLANYFLKSYATKMGKTFQGIPKSEMERLIEYDWPGNVRELENIIERGTILSSGLLFKVPELWSNHPEIPHLQEDITLRGNERRHILWALKKTGWKVRGQKGAAELLKIHPSTLAFRMKKLGIQRPPKYPTSGRNAKREWEHGVNSLSRKEEGIRGLQA